MAYVKVTDLPEMTDTPDDVDVLLITDISADESMKIKYTTLVGEQQDLNKLESYYMSIVNI